MAKFKNPWSHKNSPWYNQEKERWYGNASFSQQETINNRQKVDLLMGGHDLIPQIIKVFRKIYKTTLLTDDKITLGDVFRTDQLELLEMNGWEKKSWSQLLSKEFKFSQSNITIFIPSETIHYSKILTDVVTEDSVFISVMHNVINTERAISKIKFSSTDFRDTVYKNIRSGRI